MTDRENIFGYRMRPASKPAGVLLSPSDYDELVYRKSFLDSVEKGIADVESGRTQTKEELRKTLRTRRSAGNPSNPDEVLHD